MAFITANAHGEQSFLRKLISGLAEGITNYMEYHSRQDVIARLEAKSDAELAAMGITRDGIVQHVFRDRFYM
ncbi:hypothetical protein [Thioclava indica]|uniref:DUF1127 domain-containing protein n=1 Tax=Thioclava indica TaxID=1353528 RepID=A0A074KCF8_9RHOB|nr:hypothetical protein [Thioclava indica]KEO59232.1 hypothetical protein DT23_03925 [Thioclava indica]